MKKSSRLHSTLFPYTTLFRSRGQHRVVLRGRRGGIAHRHLHLRGLVVHGIEHGEEIGALLGGAVDEPVGVEPRVALRSEEHTSELQSQFHLVCRLLLEKKKMA